jgi:hypothetical protein
MVRIEYTHRGYGHTVGSVHAERALGAVRDARSFINLSTSAV